jgi:hypothetical protein
VPGVPAGLDPELSAPLRRRVRLAFQRGGVQLVFGQVPASGVAKGEHLVPLGRVGEPLLPRVEEPLIDSAHVLGRHEAGEA